MTPFLAGLSDELDKLANIIEPPLRPTAAYRSDTKHFGAPEPGGPQNSGGDLTEPNGKVRTDHEAPGDPGGPVKVANDPIQKTRVVKGVKCALEWPKGTTRTYYSKADPKKVTFRKLMKADYGYIPGTRDADGEQLDVYVGPNPSSDKVFMIRQLKTDGSFDENKVMLGYDSLDEAKKSYLDHMPRNRLGKVTETTVEKFKASHLVAAKRKFQKKAADLGAIGGSLIDRFTRLRGKKQPKTDAEDCPACSLADQVDEPVPSQSGAEAHF